MASSTVENYLKHLYLQQPPEAEGGLVPTGRLAAALNVTPGTATTMVKALAESGLVEHEPHGGARLTSRGRRLALHVLRRHRLLELFLVEILGLDWSEVHEEAEVLEHALSDKVLDRIDSLLGHPTVDPHGDPIPSSSGTLPDRDLRGLDACQAGELVRIARVIHQDPVFLRYAHERGLQPGARLEIVGVDPLADSVTVRPIGAGSLTVSTATARQFLATSESAQRRS